MTPTEDARPDHPQYISAVLADLIDGHVRGKDVEWPDFVNLEAVGAAGSARRRAAGAGAAAP